MIEELLHEFKRAQIDMVLDMAIKHAEQLPGGSYFAPPRTPDGEGFVLNKKDQMMMLLSRKDVARMYGLCYPEKVHGSCNVKEPEPEPRQETAFEKAIKDQAEVKPEEDLKDAQALMGDI